MKCLLFTFNFLLLTGAWCSGAWCSGALLIGALFTMECERLKENLLMCNCTYEPCARKGRCCECIAYHVRSRQLPACAFPPNVEKTFDRSFKAFIAAYK